MHKVNYQTHKTYFPFILVGLSILLATVLYATYSGNRSANSVGADHGIGLTTTSIVAPTHDQYVASVAPILNDYLVDQDANRAYTRLAEITVPVADLSTHLELVIIFGKFQSSEATEASARYQALKQTISWLP